jgi:hypothetical protein
MTSLLKTLKKSGDKNGDKNINDMNINNTKPLEDKFNPDVANLYNQTSELRNTTSYEFTNQGYKTIMTEKVTQVVKSQEDLKVKYERSNEQDKLQILKKIQELEDERLKEKTKLNEQIDHSRKLEELIKVKRKEISDNNYQASTHGELKEFQIKNNDRNKKEKERFNGIVSSLNDILNN